MFSSPAPERNRIDIYGNAIAKGNPLRFHGPNDDRKEAAQ